MLTRPHARSSCLCCCLCSNGSHSSMEAACGCCCLHGSCCSSLCYGLLAPRAYAAEADAASWLVTTRAGCFTLLCPVDYNLIRSRPLNVRGVFEGMMQLVAAMQGTAGFVSTMLDDIAAGAGLLCKPAAHGVVPAHG